MYAYVRFRDDNHRAVVETTDFRNFNPKHKDDSENKWYEVFWQDEVQSDYFKAQVVRLYASREDAEKRGKRVPIPPPPSDDSDASSSDEWEPKVFLGNGVEISRAAFNHLMSRPKDSIFVREASVAIFSTAGLLGRSVTGPVSNRTKTDHKPALDSLKYEALSGMC
ncbi:hypothetical protein HPB52_022508 [Rhipicephalus sanguineus]|uniref:Uncharacterized protein n=1 Tax=Rhipicephalus sanguineus TaxID=34632 RepID=A0A9D4SXW3_RHISA|nr:hypothetical protein HPB52_022508 [Rhipicephalus sanguineus]